MRALHVVVALLVLSPLAHAQEWRDQLKADVVKIHESKMLCDEVGLYKVQLEGYPPAQMQVKVHSEAPVDGVISRDNFVSLTTLTFTTLFLGVLSEAYNVPASRFLDAVDYSELQAPIGTPDLELNLVMTNEGMQIEIVNTAASARSRQTMTWAEAFAK